MESQVLRELAKAEKDSYYQIVDMTKYENGQMKVDFKTGKPFTQEDIYQYSRNVKELGKWIRKTFINIFQLTSISELIKITEKKIEYILKTEERIKIEKEDLLRFFKYLQTPNVKGEKLSIEQFSSLFSKIKESIESQEKVSLIRDEYNMEEISKVLNYWLKIAKPSDVVESLSPYFKEIDCQIKINDKTPLAFEEIQTIEVKEEEEKIVNKKPTKSKKSVA